MRRGQKLRRQQEFLAAYKQVDQSAGDKQPMGVLLQPPVAHLHKSELQLHHLKHVLDLGPHFRLRPVLSPRNFVHNLTFVATTPFACSLAPGVRPRGSLQFAPDKPHRPTPASLLRAADRARSPHRKHWPPSPPPCE